MPQQPMSRYPEDHQLPTEKSLSGRLSAPKRDKEDPQLPAENRISDRSTVPYRDIRNLNIPPTDIFVILISFFQDLFNASAAHFDISGK